MAMAGTWQARLSWPEGWTEVWTEVVKKEDRACLSMVGTYLLNT